MRMTPLASMTVQYNTNRHFVPKFLGAQEGLGESYRIMLEALRLQETFDLTQARGVTHFP